MRKKDAFTLVELLGVIVVLAILALIIIPIISNVINDIRIKALKSSAYELIEASQLYYAQYGNSSNIRFDINDNKVESKDTDNLISYKGSIKSGVVILNKKGNVTVCVTDGKNAAYKNYNENKVITKKGQTCLIETNSYIVKLSEDGDTLTELDNGQLTTEVQDIKNDLASLKEENSDLKERVTTLEDENATLTTSLATKAQVSDLSALETSLNSSITSLNSSLSSSITAVDNKIYSPVIVDVSNYQARTTTFEYTGLSVTIPAYSYYVLKGLIGYYSTQTRAVALTRTNNLTYPQCSNMDAISVNGEKACTISGTTGNSSQTFYLFGQWAGAANNNASITGFYLQKQS